LGISFRTKLLALTLSFSLPIGWNVDHGGDLTGHTGDAVVTAEEPGFWSNLIDSNCSTT
jgi:hypothetical protein